jgi:hypothetical protein
MSIIRSCAFTGCGTLTLGQFCIVHETPVAPRQFPRGRPFPPRTTLLAPMAIPFRTLKVRPVPVTADARELVEGLA